MKIFIIVNGYICKRYQKERPKNGRSETLLPLKKKRQIRLESAVNHSVVSVWNPVFLLRWILKNQEVKNHEMVAEDNCI